MKFIPKFFIFFLLLFSPQLFAQTDAAEYDTFMTNYFIYTIKLDTTLQIVTAINPVNYDHPTTTDITFKGYYKKGELVRIIRRIESATNIDSTDYFFTAGKLIYLEEKIDTIISHNPTVINISKRKGPCHCYFENEKWQILGCSGAEIIQMSQIPQLLQEAKEYAEMLNSKKH